MLTSWIQSDNKALVLVGAVVALSCILAWVSRFAPLRHAPGPWLNKYCGVEIAIAEIRGRRSQQIVAWHKQYGPIVCIAPTQVSIASLPTIRDIYSSTGRADKSSFFNHFVSFNSRSVFTTLSFPDHKRKRAVVAAFFQGTNIHGQPSIEAFIRTHALAILSQIEKRRPQAKSIDFYPLADWYAFDNITALVLGPLYASTVTKQPCKEREMLQDLKRARAWSALQQRFPWLIPIMKIAVRIYNGNTDQFEAEDRLAEWTHDRVLRSLQDCNVLGFDNLVVYLARKLGLNPGPGIRQDAQNSNNHKLVNYIAAETLDNINAAESSVAATITYVIWYMSIHPEWQQRLRAELLALPVESDGLPSFNDIDRAPILDACLKEVYRLKPASGGRAERVVPTGGRVVSDVYVPEKTVVAASIIAVHMDPSMFPNESSFCPSRWLEADQSMSARLNACVLPFGYGARVCLGKAMANMEIKILLAAMFLRYEVVPAGVQTGISMKQAAVRDGVRSGLSGEFYCRPLSETTWKD